MSHVSSLVLDSPFVNINTLAQDVADQNSNIPGVFVSMAMAVVKTTIRDKLQFEINDLQPFESINNVNVPIIFHVGRHDVLVKPSRVRAYYEKYKGNPKKQFIDSDCDHGSERDEHYYDECIRFIDNVFLSEQFESNVNKINDTDGGSILRKAMKKVLHGTEFGVGKPKANGPMLKEQQGNIQKILKGDQSPAPYSPMGIQPQNRLSQVKQNPIKPNHDQRMLARQNSETLDMMSSFNKYTDNQSNLYGGSTTDIRRNQFLSKPRAQSGYVAEMLNHDNSYISRGAANNFNQQPGPQRKSSSYLIFDQEANENKTNPPNSQPNSSMMTQGLNRQKYGAGYTDIKFDNLRKGKKPSGNEWGSSIIGNGMFRSPQLMNAGNSSRQSAVGAIDLMMGSLGGGSEHPNETLSELSISNLHRQSNIGGDQIQGQPQQKALNDQQREMLRNLMGGNIKDHSAPGSFSSNKLDGTTTAAELSGLLRQGPSNSGFNGKTIFEVITYLL